MNEFKISIPLTVRVSEINYGNHVGYQHYLTYFQEARIAYLGKLGFTEKDIGGYGMIVSEVTCRYRRELFLGDVVDVGCRVAEIKSKAFIMAYRIEKMNVTCATGATTILCFDYAAGKVVPLPPAFTAAVAAIESAG
ncbi:acyl-CoA thioesterase [Desulfococcus sp.]|uniref:acyl-CoA thioesterase n=1 Tax=Desulfococcus sp. TaxID=2025834 RepID=UPI003593555D